MIENVDFYSVLGIGDNYLYIDLPDPDPTHLTVPYLYLDENRTPNIKTGYGSYRKK